MTRKLDSSNLLNVPVCDVVVVPKDIVDRAAFGNLLRAADPSRTILYVENRPSFSGSIARTVETALANALATRTLPHDLKLDGIDPATVQMIQEGLKQGAFDDTHRIATWIGRVNQLTDLGLKLVVVHSRHHSAWLLDFVKRSKTPFAGFIFSGSAYMLSAEKDTAMVRDIRALMRICLDRQIPMLGICFGMHVLALEAFGVCVDYLTVPEGMTALQLDPSDPDKCTYVTGLTPGQRLMVYGLQRIRRRSAGHGDPIINLAREVDGGEIHSQGLLYPDERLPLNAILATSRRLWFRKPPKGKEKRSTADFEQKVIEVIKTGSVAYGTQLHPELPPLLLWVLTFLPFIADELREEGYDIELIRSQLWNSLDTSHDYFAGQRFGYNFIKRVLAPHLIERYFAEGIISETQRDDLIARLKNTNPLITISTVVADN